MSTSDAKSTPSRGHGTRWLTWRSLADPTGSLTWRSFATSAPVGRLGGLADLALTWCRPDLQVADDYAEKTWRVKAELAATREAEEKAAKTTFADTLMKEVERLG
eukprot:3241683-Pyramimonas_sp.AAC.1